MGLLPKRLDVRKAAKNGKLPRCSPYKRNPRPYFPKNQKTNKSIPTFTRKFFCLSGLFGLSDNDKHQKPEPNGKWQKAAAAGRKRISLRRMYSAATPGNKNKLSCAQKGHFVVYTSDNSCFAISLSFSTMTSLESSSGYLKKSLEFPTVDLSGFQSTHHLWNIYSLIGRGLAKDLENALLMSITSCSSSCTALEKRFSCPQLYVCSC